MNSSMKPLPGRPSNRSVKAPPSRTKPVLHVTWKQMHAFQSSMREIVFFFFACLITNSGFAYEPGPQGKNSNDAVTQGDVSDESAAYLGRTDPERARLLRERPWIETIEAEVPPLQNLREISETRDGPARLPMIMWHGVGFGTLTNEQIAMLRERGLCQHLQLHEAMIPAAKALSQQGMPVILMEGRTDSWPYSLADKSDGVPGDWAHQFDLTYQPPWFGQDDSSQWHGACPDRLEGWKVLARETAATMQKFKDAGVRVDAVLVDFEGDPYPWTHLFEQLSHCRRCRNSLPSEVVRDRAAWRSYAWKKYVELYDQYFAAPILSVFPDALVTNWHVVYSSTESPVRYFVRDIDLPVLRPQHFTATNPIAYGSDAAWRELWDPSKTPTQRAVDDFYEAEILHQVEADRINRQRVGDDHIKSIPWVARACRISSGKESTVPIMSRKRYREALGKLWTLQVHSMQVFNPMHEGYEELALQELQDAVAAYDLSLL